MTRTLIFSSLLVLGLTACPSTQPITPAPAISASGTWEGVETAPAQNNVPAYSFNVRYVLVDTAGNLSGQIYYCSDGTFNCNPTSVNGNRNGTAITLRYNSTLDDEANTPIVVVTQGTLNGTTISGTTTYPATNGTVTGTTSLTKK